MAKAISSIDYAHKKYSEGRQQPGRLSWDMLLGEFVAYSGIAYIGHPKNHAAARTERELARRLLLGIYTTRYGYGGQRKAVRLYDLKQLIESPMGRVYPKWIGKQSLQYLNRILRKHGLDEILSKKIGFIRTKSKTNTQSNNS